MVIFLQLLSLLLILVLLLSDGLNCNTSGV
jgi:hypothetical protein